LIVAIVTLASGFAKSARRPERAKAVGGGAFAGLDKAKDSAE
jgi:hypothetical protein